MALDKVVADILESAKKDADQLIGSAEKDRAATLKAAEDSIAAKRKEQEKRLAEAIKRLRQQEISSAELEAKRIVLNARKEILDSVFESTLKEMSSLSDADRAKLYAKIMAKGIKVIPDPRVYCPKGDGTLLAGVKGPSSVVETNMSAGLVLESKDGLVSLDYRFKTILEGIWEQELKNVSNLLFG
jgi:V/A-type H+-transporting ATPase subunit E